MFEELSVRDVETELVGMAGHLAAGTCRFLQLLAEFDTREGWAGPGLRSCAHWLGWRVGMDARTARDHLRVAHALTRLPATTAAFATGRVSYSKVRALTRIADADTEHTLLGVALHGTASQLDGLVRAARAGADPRPATARRAMAWSRDPDGSLLVRLRIPAERGEQLLSAVQAELAATEHSATEHSATEHSADAESGSAEPPDAHTDPAAHHRHWQADRADLAARAVEHAPGPVLEPLAARRLDALLDLVTGERHPDPATLVVHLRLDDLDQTAPSADAAAPAAPDPGLHLVPDTAEPADNSEHPDSAEPPGTDDTAEHRATTDPACLRPTAWIEDGPAVAPAVAERITCTGAVQALLVDR
ncbi:MAG: 13E12 repeat family protein, partial [Pseudonocardia sp.]|nr:13E12 repeat family protein [Pseudonocardia sp.]